MHEAMLCHGGWWLQRLLKRPHVVMVAATDLNLLLRKLLTNGHTSL
jgi:hypothetical protein